MPIDSEGYTINFTCDNCKLPGSAFGWTKTKAYKDMRRHMVVHRDGRTTCRKCLTGQALQDAFAAYKSSLR